MVHTKRMWGGATPCNGLTFETGHQVYLISYVLSPDHKVSTQGPQTTPINELDLTAVGYGEKCFKYLMLSQAEK